MSKSRMSKLALGLIIGSVAGVGAALLAAPQSGAQTRGMLLEKGAELETRASSTLEKSREKAKGFLASARTTTGQWSGSIRSRLKGPETHVIE